ncbi:hypothetical protein QTP88_009481 [Uroleucon formosanum]
MTIFVSLYDFCRFFIVQKRDRETLSPIGRLKLFLLTNTMSKRTLHLLSRVTTSETNIKYSAKKKLDFNGLPHQEIQLSRHKSVYEKGHKSILFVQLVISH